MRSIIVALTTLIGWSGCAIGQDKQYNLRVKRAGSNVYESRGVLIHTKYCYKYTYGEDALLGWNGRNGWIIFTDSDQRCQVSRVLVAGTQLPGRYSITVSREEDDLYEIVGMNVFLKTSMCLDLGLMQQAILDWRGIGGQITFLPSVGISTTASSCTIEGLWVLAK